MTFKLSIAATLHFFSPFLPKNETLYRDFFELSLCPYKEHPILSNQLSLAILSLMTIHLYETEHLWNRLFEIFFLHFVWLIIWGHGEKFDLFLAVNEQWPMIFRHFHCKNQGLNLQVSTWPAVQISVMPNLGLKNGLF